MHIFIDDSGDGGFKFDSGSSSHLIMAATVFRDPAQIEHLKECMQRCCALNRFNTEFKYTKTKERVKDCFFACTATVDYSIWAIVMDKSKIYSPKLRSSPSALKSFAISQLLSHGFGNIHDAKVVIDGQDTKAFGITDQSYLMRMTNRYSPGTVTKVAYADSKQNVGIQLADMVAGAINRGVRREKRDDKHFQLLRPRSFQPRGSMWFFQ